MLNNSARMVQHNCNPFEEHPARWRGLMLSCCTVYLCYQNDQAARLYAAYAGTAQVGRLAA